jgi:hypothetical protein
VPDERLSDERLAEIEKRCAAATPGPWEWPADHCDRFTVVAWSDGPRWGTPRDVTVQPEGRTYAQAEADAAFVARARTDVPDLVAEVRRLRAVERELRGHVRALVGRVESLAGRAEGGDNG